MESVQCVRNEEISVQLSVEEKATVDEIMKQAEFSLESQELLDQSIGVVAENESLDKAAIVTKTQVLKGVLKNQTRGPLTLMATKIWEGHIVEKIYAECGLKGKFSKINWAEVEHKLNKAGAVAKVYDRETGTSLLATIARGSVAAAYCG